MMRYALDAAGLTDKGMRRDHNEDAWAASPPDLTAEQKVTKGLLYIVADGVGGHQAGDVASAMAVDIIQQRYYADPSPDIAGSLAAAIRAANQAINQEASDRPERYGMGTTITAAVLRGDALTVANVGDSRTYLIREGQARQLTTDHTWVEEQVQIGLITRQEADRHPQRNIITRSLGGSNQELLIDFFEKRVGPGDSVLLCSDGLSNVVPGPEFGGIVGRGKSARATVRQLVGLANERGAPDNVTVVVLNLKKAPVSLTRLLISALFIIAVALAIVWLALGTFYEENKEATPTPPPLTSETGVLFSAPSAIADPAKHRLNDSIAFDKWEVLWLKEPSSGRKRAAINTWNN